jgi:hypothetical protein
LRGWCRGGRPLPAPGTFFAKKENLRIRVDDQGYTRIDREGGKPVAVCLEPKGDAFMDYFIGQLTAPGPR